VDGAAQSESECVDGLENGWGREGQVRAVHCQRGSRKKAQTYVGFALLGRRRFRTVTVKITINAMEPSKKPVA
jgi:hypothetical protein